MPSPQPAPTFAPANFLIQERNGKDSHHLRFDHGYDRRHRRPHRLEIAQGDIYEISKVTADTVAGYDTLLLGSSTWGSGDLQDDWYDGIETLKGADLAGKKIALFGCGDSSSYSDTFCSALGT